MPGCHNVPRFVDFTCSFSSSRFQCSDDETESNVTAAKVHYHITLKTSGAWHPSAPQLGKVPLSVKHLRSWYNLMRLLGIVQLLLAALESMQQVREYAIVAGFFPVGLYKQSLQRRPYS
jgi:hypothetical protein